MRSLALCLLPVAIDSRISHYSKYQHIPLKYSIWFQLFIIDWLLVKGFLTDQICGLFEATWRFRCTVHMHTSYAEIDVSYLKCFETLYISSFPMLNQKNWKLKWKSIGSSQQLTKNSPNEFSIIVVFEFILFVEYSCGWSRYRWHMPFHVNIWVHPALKSATIIEKPVAVVPKLR